MTNMTNPHEERLRKIEQARDSLERFLASPNADYIAEYLLTILQVEPLMRDTSEKTAYQVGLFDAVTELARIQKRARGQNL